MRGSTSEFLFFKQKTTYEVRIRDWSSDVCSSDLSAGKVFYLVKVDNAKFSSMVVPGDRLELCVKLKRTIRNMALFEGVARVDGEQVACAEILCAETKGCDGRGPRHPCTCRARCDRADPNGSA